MRPWHRLFPDQSIVAAGQGEGEDHLQAAKAADGSFAIVYSTLGNPFAVRVEGLSGRAVKAQWYDPRKGTWPIIGRRDP